MTIINPNDQKYIKSSLLLSDEKIEFINGFGVATTSILTDSGKKLKGKTVIGIITERYEEINLAGDDGLRFRPTTLSISRFGENDFITKSIASWSDEERVYKHFRIENEKVVCVNSDIGEYQETKTKGIIITQIGNFKRLYNIFTGKKTRPYFEILETDQEGIFLVNDIICATTETNLDYDFLYFLIDSNGDIISKVISERLGELDLNNENYDIEKREIEKKMEENIEYYETRNILLAGKTQGKNK